METQSNSNNSPGSNEALLANQQVNKDETKDLKKEATGMDYHNYVPKHSSHGRLNTRTFGADHEPGTIR